MVNIGKPLNHDHVFKKVYVGVRGKRRPEGN